MPKATQASRETPWAFPGRNGRYPRQEKDAKFYAYIRELDGSLSEVYVFLQSHHTIIAIIIHCHDLPVRRKHNLRNHAFISLDTDALALAERERFTSITKAKKSP